MRRLQRLEELLHEENRRQENSPEVASEYGATSDEEDVGVETELLSQLVSSSGNREPLEAGDAVGVQGWMERIRRAMPLTDHKNTTRGDWVYDWCGQNLETPGTAFLSTLPPANGPRYRDSQPGNRGSSSQTHLGHVIHIHMLDEGEGRNKWQKKNSSISWFGDEMMSVAATSGTWYN